MDGGRQGRALGGKNNTGVTFLITVTEYQRESMQGERGPSVRGVMGTVYHGWEGVVEAV